MNWFRKLFGLDGHEKIDEIKEEIRVEREAALKDLKKVNKKFRFTIESGTMEIIIKDIHDITGGK